MPDGSRPKSKEDERADRKARQAEELAEIRAGLRASAGPLTEMLLNEKPTSRRGSEWRFGPHGGFKLDVSGANAGLWHDKGADQGGDMLALIQRQRGGSFPDAVGWARSYLGMPEPDYSRRMSDAEQARIRARIAAEAEKRAADEAAGRARVLARQEQVARRAAFVWGAYAGSPATAEHPYVARKGVDPSGLRVNRRGLLLVPASDVGGKLWSLQRIWPNGDKRGLKGGRMKGCVHVLGEPDGTRPIIFCEGEATGRSIHAATGLPTVVCFSVSNLREVMTAWRARNPDQVLMVAGDNDHHKPRQDPPKPNVGAEMAERLRTEIGAVPVLPPFAAEDAGKDWNDFHQVKGPDAVRAVFDRALEAAMKLKQEAPMPDGSTVAATAAPAEEKPDPRRVLTEALAVEGVRVRMAPEDAVRVAKAAVAALSDEEVAERLSTAGDRKWAVRPDGTLDPGAKASATGPDPSPAPAAAAANPLRDLLGQLQGEAQAIEARAPDLARQIQMLTAKADEPGVLDHANMRTRIAYAVLDTEKLTGRDLSLPADLRREMNERAVSYPGLTHNGVLSLLRQTTNIEDAGLVREIRRFAASTAKLGADQDNADVHDRLAVLENKLRVYDRRVIQAADLEGAPPAERLPSEPRPAPAPTTTRSAEASVTPVTVAASPGPGEQRQPNAAAPPVAASAQAAAPAQTRTAAPKQTLAGGILSAMRPEPPPGTPPWDRVTQGLGERTTMFERRMEEGRISRQIEGAAAAGRTAMEAVERFAAGPGRQILDRIQAEAAKAPGGLSSVMAEMRPGGVHAALRAEFDAAMRRPEFAKAYEQMRSGVEKYGNARAAVPPAQAPSFERTDAALGEELARVPGKSPGRSAMDELAAKVAEILREAVEKVRAAVSSAAAIVRPSQGTAPSPAP